MTDTDFRVGPLTPKRRMFGRGRADGLYVSPDSVLQRVGFIEVAGRGRVDR